MKIDWNALLRRQPGEIAHEQIAASISGRRILVTGAAGSLGRDLTDFLAGYAPDLLVAVDNHESSLFHLRQQLTARAPGVRTRFVLGDVRNRRKLTAVFAETAPEHVFHLAAYKHVPWAEEDPAEFAAVNLLGAGNIVRACLEAGVARVIYPSTDKAVNPPSLYGATKRIVERLLRAMAHESGVAAGVVRFVNVLGSQGSVTETFARQIAAGTPLTITDPAMTRYWIAPEQGTLSLVYAACLPGPWAMVIPDAGEPIAVAEIAARMWRAMRPGEPGPELRFTGLRPGERLHEELAAAPERLERGPLPGILAVRDDAPPADLSGLLADLDALAERLAVEVPSATRREEIFSWARAL